MGRGPVFSRAHTSIVLLPLPKGPFSPRSTEHLALAVQVWGRPSSHHAGDDKEEEVRWGSFPGFHGNENSRLVVAEALYPHRRVSARRKADVGQARALVQEVVRGTELQHEL